MQFIPVDAARLGACLCVIPPDERRSPDGRQRTDRDGRPQWVVSVSVRQRDRRAVDVIDVVVPGEPRGLVEGAPVVFEELEAIQWAMEGRSGISWRAVAVRPAESSATAPAVGARGKSAGGER
jgi:hypothetical protein